MNDIKIKLDVINQKIREYELKYGREKKSVKLLAASKGQSVEKIRSAIAAEQKIFGENYLQEALPKIESINKDHNDIEWHFIGPIQSNKSRKIAENFSWVQSISSMKVADRLNEQRPIELPPLNICIEVNVDAEKTKSGVSFEEAKELVIYCSALPNLCVRGLMAIPKQQAEFMAQRREFQRLANLWDELKQQGYELDTLSMGMTEDFEAAIAEGSTMVRIGTGIFGPRESKERN